MALNLQKNKVARRILLLVAICAGLAVVGFFRPASLLLYTLQTKIATKPVSGDIVVVGIDSPSIESIGRWPWPRDKQAELIKKIDGYGPKSVYIDIGYHGRTTPKADAELRSTLEKMTAPTKVVALATDEDGTSVRSVRSHPDAVGSAEVVTAYVPYIFGYVWELPITVKTNGGNLQSVAASIIGVNDPQLSPFRIDYLYDPNSIPVFSAEDIINQTISPDNFKGKVVIVGITDLTHNDIHSMPGWGERAGVLLHVLGAETLKNGIPKEWGWIVFFALALALCVLHLSRYGLKYSQQIIWAGAIGILGTSTWLTTLHVGNEPLPAIALLGSLGIYIGRQKAALVRSQRNAGTGFSDMTGYNVREVISNATFIGATLYRPETRFGYVLPDDDAKIMREAGRRLSTVIDERQLTHNDHRQFLWEMPNIPTGDLAEHLTGLRQLFAEPLVIDGRKIDIDIHFGVDRNTNNDVKNRMKSALKASIEASNSQSAFKIATTAEFEAHLKSQFAVELEAAIANGDIELMLEAETNLSSHYVESAAASLRWTHPAHGQIATAKLFDFARESGNLPKVSGFLCEQSVAAAAAIIKRIPGFSVSVKVSMDMILTTDFNATVLGFCKKAECNPNAVVLEIVDIQNYRHDMRAQRAFRHLQTQGFRVGLGDFGMTNADIDLLKIFKPDEIFLIKSFSAEFFGSTSNQIFAQSALRIARDDNITITADGIDDRDVLAELRRRGCDKGKGKIIAIPLTLNDFISAHGVAEKAKVG
jgi:EAL domain-containing protein (putative c-di-GMP-specific phosphodiesterase class I)/CHASE2 domain-containing sensor protein